jgi:hypothetical protein
MKTYTPIPCSVCGRTFTPHAPRNTMCGEVCQQIAQKRRDAVNGRRRRERQAKQRVQVPGRPATEVRAEYMRPLVEHQRQYYASFFG